MIKVLSNITLERRAKFEFDNPWIILEGKNTGKTVEGAYLEGAIQWGDFHIIFTTENTWETSGLYVLFYSPEFLLLDSAYLGSFPISNDAKFRIIKIIQPGCIIVSYDRLWKIHFLPKKRILIPFISEPFDVTRGNSFSGHFLVSHATA